MSELHTVIPDEQVALANASGSTVIKLFSRAVQDMTVDASSSKTFLQVSGESLTLEVTFIPLLFLLLDLVVGN